MTKKTLLTLVLAILVTGGVSAQPLWSVGGGLLFDSGGYRHEDWTGRDRRDHHFASGVWVFVDAAFVELSVGLLRGTSYWERRGGSLFIITDEDGYLHRTIERQDGSRPFTMMDVSLLGKWPFYFEGMSIFPLLGIGYSIEHIGWWHHALRINFGVGGDFDISRNLFIRASILGSCRDFFHNYLPTTFGVTAKIGIGRRL